MLTMPFCVPKFHPGNNFVDKISHNKSQQKYWYTVEERGLFTINGDARAAMDPARHGRDLHIFDTRALAIEDWQRRCANDHDHSHDPPSDSPSDSLPPVEKGPAAAEPSPIKRASQSKQATGKALKATTRAEPAAKFPRPRTIQAALAERSPASRARQAEAQARVDAVPTILPPPRVIPTTPHKPTPSTIQHLERDVVKAGKAGDDNGHSGRPVFDLTTPDRDDVQPGRPVYDLTTPDRDDRVSMSSEGSLPAISSESSLSSSSNVSPSSTQGARAPPPPYHLPVPPAAARVKHKESEHEDNSVSTRARPTGRSTPTRASSSLNQSPTKMYVNETTRKIYGDVKMAVRDMHLRDIVTEMDEAEVSSVFGA
ncbi:hypothetical protein FB45DRAFT_944102 [Roridomyces roridus]|uniref:Uncharacterized protein n=1 Tax=Roridomyces roridus TaxID=1738132 RepID=A0AAD7B4B0_9AGAR|nr:hypothetical protein FB45DRAFT_944102 [Roridomyces roridus]